jgi:hypothetical protein
MGCRPEAERLRIKLHRIEHRHADEKHAIVERIVERCDATVEAGAHRHVAVLKLIPTIVDRHPREYTTGHPFDTSQ